MEPHSRHPTSESSGDTPQGTRPNGPAPRSTPPQQRVGVYERLGRSTGLPPALTLGVAIAIVGLIIFIIMMLAR